MMLLHIPRGTGKPVLISLPRDSYVPIPGHGRNKLNAAHAFGGPKLLSRTVEEVTGIRLDYGYMEVGFDGFASVVDAVGGVQICPETAMRDPMAGLNVKAGCQEANSKTALAYVRARHSGRGDLDRVERQQEFLGALIKKSTSPATVLNPFRSVPCSCGAPRRSPSTRRPTSGTWSGSCSLCATSAGAAASGPPSRSPARPPSLAPARSSSGTASAPWPCSRPSSGTSRSTAWSTSRPADR